MTATQQHTYRITVERPDGSTFTLQEQATSEQAAYDAAEKWWDAHEPARFDSLTVGVRKVRGK